MKKITILILAVVFAFGPVMDPVLAYAGEHMKPQCQHECAIPDAGDDTDDQYISQTSVDGEGTSLQSIFDVRDFRTDVEDDQKEYQGWNAINATTTFTASYVAGYSAHLGVFGYYLNGDLNSFVPLFTSASSTGSTATVEVAGPTVIGFAIKSGATIEDATFYASHNALNEGGNDHMVAYDLDNNTFVLGFEDLPIASSDKDYNDMVVKVVVAPCDTDNGGPVTPPVNNPPVLTIVGNNPLEIVENTVFIDPGATSTDVEDGDLTTSIIVTGSVNASTTGTYTLVYTVTDSKGASVSANRIVNVVPAPVIPPSCANLPSMTGWYGSYFDYSALHTDMEENPSTWGNSHGDPLGVSAPWTADWYDASYKKFERVDANIEFGGSFFPMDSVAGAEITNGHNYHFGSVWTAKVTASTTGSYAYTLTSDDDAWVYVDGVLKVDNSLIHAPQTKTGSINLTAGTHTVAIYFAERHTVESHMHFKFMDSSLVIKPFNPTCPAPANTAPVIALKGSNPTQVVVNNAFVDQGATSTDAEDGDLTSQIVVTGTVNTAATGTYTLVYTVTDSGNLSASTTRTVNVVPAGNNGGGNTNTPPKITLIGNNPFNVATDTAFIDPGATSTDAEDGDLTSSIVVTGTVNASTTGSYVLTYSVTDSGGLSTSTTRTVIINATTTVTTPTTPTAPTNNGGGGGGRSGRRHDIGAVLGASTCTYLEDYLRRDWNNDPVEVMKLQSFLNIFEKETLAVNGTFDQATFDATSRFQNKYASDILTPWGHTAPTGFVYILTKKKVNEIYCNTQIALTVGEQNEIAAFRAFLETVPAGTVPAQNGLPIDLDDYVGMNNNEGETDGGFSVGNVANNVASTVKDTVSDITNNTGLKNLAVSLLGSPKGLKEISSTYLLILIGLILIAAFAPRRADKNSITAVKSDASATLTPSAVVEAPKAEDFEQPAPIVAAEEQKEESKPEDKDKGFKGIIG